MTGAPSGSRSLVPPLRPAQIPAYLESPAKVRLRDCPCALFPAAARDGTDEEVDRHPREEERQAARHGVEGQSASGRNSLAGLPGGVLAVTFAPNRPIHLLDHGTTLDVRADVVPVAGHGALPGAAVDPAVTRPERRAESQGCAVDVAALVAGALTDSADDLALGVLEAGGVGPGYQREGEQRDGDEPLEHVLGY